jgi:hypothetical protein
VSLDRIIDDADTIEEIVRRVVREEVGRLLPRFEKPKGAFLSIKECAARYGRSYDYIRDMIADERLEAMRHYDGRRGRGQCQFLIPVAVADTHPDLGGLR